MFFRGNVAIVSLNVMIFNLCGKELTGLPTFVPLLYNSKCWCYRRIKKKQANYFSHVSFANKYIISDCVCVVFLYVEYNVTQNSICDKSALKHVLARTPPLYENLSVQYMEIF